MVILLFFFLGLNFPARNDLLHHYKVVTAMKIESPKSFGVTPIGGIDVKMFWFNYLAISSFVEAEAALIPHDEI
jgi:hypothetical protein